MTKSVLIVFILVNILSCKSPGSSPDGKVVKDTTGTDTSFKKENAAPLKQGIYTPEGDSLVIPPFEIEITLSPKAKERIVNNKETIIVSVFLTGDPADSAKVELTEDGSFFLGSGTQEISYGTIARFENLKLSKRSYDQLAEKDPELTVNVYTGRRSSQDNLITGDILIDKVSKVAGKRFTLHHKLIWGDE